MLVLIGNRQPGGSGRDLHLTLAGLRACASLASMTNEAAKSLAAKRWANVTPEQKKAHGKKMAAARWGKTKKKCLRKHRG